MVVEPATSARIDTAERNVIFLDRIMFMEQWCKHVRMREYLLEKLV
jgi:hypothetical protein